MTTLTVGSGQQYSTLAAAVAASQNGDIIDVMAGTYTNDFSNVTDNITIQGVGGMAHFVATSSPPNGKAILDVHGNITINNLEFSGAAVPDGNGAGIRYEAGNLVLNDDYFHDNQDGLLANPDPTGTITINNSEFAHNGTGDGLTHNLYVNDVATLTINDSYFHDAVVGHEIKSRAENTIITNSRIQNGPTGTASYDIDLPNGGNGVIENDVIQQGPDAQNPSMIEYGIEGMRYASNSLTIANDTILNDLPGGGAWALANWSANPSVTARVTNNQFYGLTSDHLIYGPASVTGSTFLTTEPALDTSHPFTPGGGPPTNVTLTTSGNSVIGGSAQLTVTDSAGGNTIVGGSGGLVFKTTAGGDLVSTAAGATDTLTLKAGAAVNSHGTDSIVGGAGNSTITVNGTATIQGGTGANQYVLNGNDVLKSNGTDTVTVGAAAFANLHATGSVTVNEGGGTLQFAETGTTDAARVVGGGATLTDNAGGALSITTAAGKATLVILGAGGVVTSAGADTITAGTASATIGILGAASVKGGSGTAFITGGSGISTVRGGAGSTTYQAGSGATLFYGGSGAANLAIGTGTVVAGSGNVTLSGGETFFAGTGQADVTLGSGGDTVRFGAAATTVTAGTGRNVFQFFNGSGGGADVINGFNNGGDVLNFHGFGGAAIMSQAAVGNSLQIGLTDGTTLVLNGLTSLHPHSVIYT